MSSVRVLAGDLVIDEYEIGDPMPTRVCIECGEPLPDDWFDELCEECMEKEGLL